MKGIKIDESDFGTLCVCAIRYCQGRETYMPSVVQRIVWSQIGNISDKDLHVMIEDCDFQRRYSLYGNEKIDKPGWLEFERFLKGEMERRKSNK